MRLFLFLAFLFSPSLASAQTTPAPGGTCSTTGQTATSPNSAGTMNELYCNGTNWVAISPLIGKSVSTCNSSATGALYYDSTTDQWQYCNGSSWRPFESTGTTPPVGSGFFVFVNISRSGNWGGLSGADSICLTALTTNTGWKHYSIANSRGLLILAKVRAFLCDATTCNNLAANTRFYFSNTGDATAGGGYFTTDASGIGPNDSDNWLNGSRFGGIGTVGNWWGGHGTSAATAWSNTPPADTCNGLTSASASYSYVFGFRATGGGRWNAGLGTCSNGLPYICFVNP